MSDFIEIDFLEIESQKSGDAITMRYKHNNVTTVHVIDGGGFGPTGEKIVQHIKTYYGENPTIDRVVVTHPDCDHVRGLRTVLEQLNVKELWMMRPWLYGEILIERFKRWCNPENLTKKLKELYPHIKALEDIANQKQIPIKEPIQGAKIGEFTVLAPSEERYINLIAESEGISKPSSFKSTSFLDKKHGAFKSIWGDENLSNETTSAQNEMSVVQYANLSDSGILLTGDAGRETLIEALDYLESINDGILPKIDKFQVPHHGACRNISSEILDRLFGEKLNVPAENSIFTAIISAAKKDKNHPKKAVIRALHHRGAMIISAEEKSIRTMAGYAPSRDGWSPATPIPYPNETIDPIIVV